MNVDSNALWVANSAFNASGVLVAAKVWSSFLDRKQSRLLWLVPAVLLSAWLETNLNASFAGAPAMTSGMYKHFAMDVVAFAGLALLEPMFYSLVWKRQDGTWRLLREFVHQKSAPQWN